MSYAKGTYALTQNKIYGAKWNIVVAYFSILYVEEHLLLNEISTFECRNFQYSQNEIPYQIVNFDYYEIYPFEKALLTVKMWRHYIVIFQKYRK